MSMAVDDVLCNADQVRANAVGRWTWTKTQHKKFGQINEASTFDILPDFAKCRSKAPEGPPTWSTGRGVEEEWLSNLIRLGSKKTHFVTVSFSFFN